MNTHLELCHDCARAIGLEPVGREDGDCDACYQHPKRAAQYELSAVVAALVRVTVAQKTSPQ